MVIYDLICHRGHRFEVWFKDAGAYLAQKAAFVVQCSVCGTSRVERVPSQLHMGKSLVKPATSTTSVAPRPKETPPVSQPAKEKLDAVVMMKSLQKYVKENFVDVGESFSTHAIAMHKGEETHKPIYGTATQEQREQLDEEGVSYVPLPKLSHSIDN